MNRLSDLDDRLVPALGRRAKALLATLPKPSYERMPLPERLRRVDERFARRGPLAFLREVPELAALLVGALIFTGLASARIRVGHRAHDNTPAAVASPTPTPGQPDHLGPQLGDDVTQYIYGTRRILAHYAQTAPDGTAVAVVSFTSYRTPEEVRDLVGPLQIRKIFYRVPLPLPLTESRQIPVIDVVKESHREFVRVAAVRLAAARELRKVAATNVTDQAQKDSDLKDAALYEREAKILKGPCACVYAAVVVTRLRLLADLLTMRGVRVVDASGPDGRLEDFEYTALLPEEKITVTGGNQSG